MDLLHILTFVVKVNLNINMEDFESKKLIKNYLNKNGQKNTICYKAQVLYLYVLTFRQRSHIFGANWKLFEFEKMIFFCSSTRENWI